MLPQAGAQLPRSNRIPFPEHVRYMSGMVCHCENTSPQIEFWSEAAQ